jgi:hypothetical protein
LRKSYEINPTSAEIKFLHAVKGCAREDRTPNQEIRRELQILAVHDKITT